MRSVRCALRVLTMGLVALCAREAFAAGAEIVMLQGQGERTENASPQPVGWVAAVEGDVIEGGYWVRTLADSQMALVVPARNQMRLAPNSVMQLKTAEETAEFTQARAKLVRGRAWSQARPRGEAGAGGPPALAMETPSATLSIRGTDWEVEVAEDGTTQVVVLSGQVDVGNEHGELSVGKGEAARVEVGKAPVKLVLVDPESRVQWVSSWQPVAARWIGTEAPRYAAEIARIEAGEYAATRAALEPRAAADAGAALLAADILVYEGEIARAVALLEPHAAQGRGDPRASALLARALVRLDRLDEAEALLDAAIAAHEGDAELLIARGELAVLRGDAATAQQAYGDALRAADVGLKAAPQAAASAGLAAGRQTDTAAEALYGLGLIAAEREYVREARRHLDAALARDPELGKAAAERAAVETFAGNLDEARSRYDALLEREGANYVALTGRGINRLKQGDAEGALQDFLRAGLVEPRYARAWLYQGVAFYQLGELTRAAQAFEKAETLDARDPIPHMMASQTAADRLDYGAAIAEARAAQQKMPWLRSLNQLANDQKGSANLGSPIANFGMEEWGKYYADEAYSPYWAGSHLFLADRYTGQFTKNSELMKGFLSDPLAFGASNRQSSLVRTPGHYQRMDLEHLRSDYELGSAVGTVNGMLRDPLDSAYFVRLEGQEGDSRKDNTWAGQRSLTAGLGLMPRHDIGVFGFLVDNELTSDVRNETLRDVNLQQDDQIADLGISLRFSPVNQAWLKAGNRNQENRASGVLVSPAGAAGVNAFIAAIEQQNGVDLGLPQARPRGELNLTRTGIDAEDQQFRHSFTVDDTQWSWGVEHSQQEQSLVLESTFRPARIANDEAFTIEDLSGWLGMVRPLGETWTVQGDLVMQDTESDRHDERVFTLIPYEFDIDLLDEQADANEDGFTGRVGVSWEPEHGQLLRFVAQKWRRPASFGSLMPADTLGIALNDRLPAAGGVYERLRLQFDGEIGDNLFVQLFADHELIDNGLAGERTALFGYQVNQLAQLRANQEFYAPPDEYEETPIFPQGSVETLGVALNRRIGEQFTVSARYLWRDTDSDTAGPDGDDWIPYLPRDYLFLQGRWSTPWRVQLAASATWRGERLENPSGLPLATRVDGGWAFGLRAYWETMDEHHSLQALVEHLAPDTDTMTENYQDPFIKLQYGYRF